MMAAGYLESPWPGEDAGPSRLQAPLAGDGLNLLAGRLLGRNLVRTAVLYPLALGGAYLVLFALGSPSLVAMVVICLLWGAVHTSGLVVSQVWLTSAAPEAPAFATSLYISAANLGVMLGSAVGGGFISANGMQGALWSGWLFAALALLSMLLKVRLFNRRPDGLLRH